MKYRIREHNELKPSGVEWLGDIPKEWQVKKLKYFAKIKNGQNQQNVLDDEGIYPIFGSGGIFGKANNYLSNKASVLLGRKGTIDKPIYIDTPFWTVDTMYYTNILKIANPKFFFYGCLGIPFKLYQYGSAIPSMTQEDLHNIYFAFPNIIKQEKIAHFLDEKSKIFDDAISKKEQLIAKLELAKQALISEVVTGKLKVVESNSKLHTIKRAPSELKPSGVEWLGVIPNEWQVKKLKYISEIISSNVDKKSYEGQEKVLLCNYVDVYKNDLITNKINFMEATANESEIKKFSLQFGDILITKDSESPDDIAIPAYVNENFENVLCGYHLAILRNSKKEVYSKYLFRFFELVGVRNYFETMAKGVTRYGLSLDAFKNIFVPHFDLTEQQQISKYLDEKLIHFDNIIAKTKQSITKLKEAEEALISEAVTGKIEVIEKESKANEYFQRRVLAAYFIDNSKNDIYFGRVKLQKLLYMAEAVNNLDFGSDYRRHAMGPHDSKMIRSIESQLKKAKWFEAQKIKNGNFEKVEYIALENHAEYLKYLDGRYWKQENIEYIFNLMKGMRTLQAEIVATVYSAYIDLSKQNRVSTENLLDEILNHWHDNKKNISQENWLKAIEWMCEKQLIKV